MTLEKKVLEVFNKILRTSFEELNVSRNKLPEWDSMRHAELIVALQERFQVKFKIKDISSIENARDFIMALEKVGCKG